MFRIMRVKGGKAEEGEEEEARRVKWEEVCFVMEQLEEAHGWEAVDGRKYYTPDGGEGHKSMVLGESPLFILRRD